MDKPPEELLHHKRDASDPEIGESIRCESDSWIFIINRCF